MARSKRTRVTLSQGCYQDAHGITVIARLGSGKNLITSPPIRFPLEDEDGIPYSRKNNVELVKCYLQLLEDLKLTRARAGGAAGSLGAAIDAWKLEFPLTPRADGKVVTDDKRADDHRLLTHWRTSPLAVELVTTLKRSQVRAQLKAWTEAGRGPTTVAHRRRALTDLLRWALGADDDENVTLPTEGIANPPPRDPEPRGVPLPILNRIIGTMSDRGRAVRGGTRPAYSENKIRLRVMAWTALPHKSLERLARTRVNFSAGKMYFPPRKKAKGAPGVWIDLLPPAIDGLRDYDRAGLWGKRFSRSSMHKAYRRAVVKTRKALVAEAEQTENLELAAAARIMLEQFDAAVPANPYPYDTRHSFLTDVTRRYGRDAAQAIGQHADIKTTDRYTRAAVPEIVAAAIDGMRAHWFPNAPKPGATVRDFHVVGQK